MIRLSESTFLRFSKLIKRSTRNNSINATSQLGQHEEKTSKETHIYKQIMTKPQVINFLAENIVYNKGGIIVTNKPYGIGKSKETQRKKAFEPQTFYDLYLDEILPELGAKLGYDTLKPVTIPERHASGVMILAATEKAEKMIAESIKRGRGRGMLMNNYIVVSIGHLTMSKEDTKFAVEIVKSGNKTTPTVLTNWSKKMIKKHRVKPVLWKHEVVGSSNFASLVKIQLSNTRWNSLRLYMATKCLSPVLGDVIFSSRVKNVLGVPLLTDPSVNIGPQKYPPEMLSALKISHNEMKIIPSHVHLHSVVLPIKPKMDFFISVPPPESFVWTCKQLDLVTDEASPW